MRGSPRSDYRSSLSRHVLDDVLDVTLDDLSQGPCVLQTFEEKDHAMHANCLFVRHPLSNLHATVGGIDRPPRPGINVLFNGWGFVHIPFRRLHN